MRDSAAAPPIEKVQQADQPNERARLLRRLSLALGGSAVSRTAFRMAEPLDPTDLVTLDDLAISNMWETSALVELLERKGILTRHGCGHESGDLPSNTQGTEQGAARFVIWFQSPRLNGGVLSHFGIIDTTGLPVSRCLTNVIICE